MALRCSWRATHLTAGLEALILGIGLGLLLVLCLLLVYDHSSTAYSDLDINKIRVLASTRLHCSKVTSITAIYEDKNRDVPAHSRGTSRTPSAFDSPTQALSNQPWKGILLKSMIATHHLFRAVGVVPAMTRLDTYSHGLP